MVKINYNIPVILDYCRSLHKFQASVFSSFYDSLEQAAKEGRKRSLLCVFWVRMRGKAGEPVVSCPDLLGGPVGLGM